MKLISDLKVGDKLFVIIKKDWLFDVCEVIKVTKEYIRVQFYIYTYKYYLWRGEESVHDTVHYCYFTDENEAIEEFKFILKHNQDGRNR